MKLKSLLVFFSLFILSGCLLFSGCMKEEFGGVGIEVPAGTEKVTKKNPFVIVSVFEGGTGEAAGLKKNDRIVRVDGVPLDGLQQDYIVKSLLRGKVGSMIMLEIVREIDGVATNMVFSVPRGNIVIQK
ncbi:MAG: S41 family peptidase [Spirochaetota bacterium]